MNLGKVYFSGIAATLIVSFSGCGTEEENKGAEIQKLTVSEMANKCYSDYESNTYGLVTANKVASWITDWENNKPSGIDGKLVILMAGSIEVGDANAKYIKGDGEHVVVYEASSLLGSTVTRNDGVSDISKAVYDGARIDDVLIQTGIDPTKDLLLFMQGNGTKSGKNLLSAARMWYMMSYWGVRHKHMALLNGNASYVLNPAVNSSLPVTKAEIFDANQTELPNNGTASIKDIRCNGTAIQATMGDMRKIIDQGLQNVTILDTRSSAEYQGEKRAKTELKTCGVNRDEQCYTPFDGHITGAKSLVYSSIIDMTQTADLDGDGNATEVMESSFVFKSQSEMEEIFTEAGYTEGEALYIYCRTGTKASLVTFTASQIMGYPTRMYDGSWIQWGKLAHRADASGSTVIPPESKWRMDVDKYSESITYNGEELSVHTLDPATLYLDASTTNAIIEEDTAYKRRYCR